MRPRSPAATGAPSSRIALVLNTLVNTTARNHRTQLFGSEIKAPLVIAPTGMKGILRRDGDIMLAKRPRAAAGIPFCMSTVSTVPIERLASEAGGRLWMQLYVMKNRKVAESIVKRAHAAGFEALVLTTDANVFGYREWDRRNYLRPGRPTFRSRLDALRHPRWLYDVVLSHGMPEFVNFADFLPPVERVRSGAARSSRRCSRRTSHGMTSSGCADLWDRKLLIKGVLSVSDAEKRSFSGLRWGDSHQSRRAAARLLCRAASRWFPIFRLAVGNKDECHR